MNPERDGCFVYLAHGTEDKAVARPLAEGLMARGIDLWFDEWEIHPGDSLRKKMEQGLGRCTHFVVLLTSVSITKPWVNEEMDVGLLRAVEGSARFIGLRHNLDVSQVPLFLQTRYTPKFDLGDSGLDELSGRIRGLSRKPPLGKGIDYRDVANQATGWSVAARVVAGYVVRHSANGTRHDPNFTLDDVQNDTGLPRLDVRLGVLELEKCGLLERSMEIGGPEYLWPQPEFFESFDRYFMSWDTETDAQRLSVHLLNLGTDRVETRDVAETLGWPPRRFNVAVTHLLMHGAVRAMQYFDEHNYAPPGLLLGEELLFYVHSKSKM